MSLEGQEGPDRVQYRRYSGINGKRGTGVSNGEKRLKCNVNRVHGKKKIVSKREFNKVNVNTIRKVHLCLQ